MAITLIAGMAAGAALYVGAAVGTAIMIGLGAAAIFDYVMDSMMEDVSVDTMGGRTVTKKDSTASRKLIYGTVRTGGTIVYQANSGENNKYLHNFIVFSDGQNDEVSAIYFDDVKVYGNTPDLPNNYKYYGKYADPDDNTVGNKVLIHATGQDLAGSFTHNDLPDQWTSFHRLSGLSYAYIRLEYSDEIYTNGFPKITAIIKGKKLYDPRQDDTATDYNGSGNVNQSVLTTWTYSDNPAVCLLSYMLDDRIGLGESLDAFDAPSLLASMNDCDIEILGKAQITGGEFAKKFVIGRKYEITASVGNVDWTSVGADATDGVGDTFIATADGSNLIAGGTVKAVYKKYTCNGIIDSKNSHKANIQNILTAMNGQLLYSGGKYHVKSYKYETPHSQVVTEDMIIGNIDIATKASRRSLYNRVKGKFISKEHNYVMTEYPAQIYKNPSTNSRTFEIDDGETLYHEYNLPMTIDVEVAQRLARLTMLRSRMQSSIKFTANAKGLLYTVGDNIKVTNSTLGITEKVYQIQRLNVRPDAEKGLTVSIEAKENVEDFYTWDEDDALDFTSGQTVSLFDGSVSAPTNLKLESYFENNTSKIRAEWTASSTQGDIIYKVFYRNNISAQYRAIQQPNTYENFIEIDVKNEYQQFPILVVVQAMSQATGVVSDSLTGTVTAAKIDKVNPNNIVRGTIANPTVHELSLLAFEAGINLNDGEDITYLQELAGEVVNSFEFGFEQVQLSNITLKVNNNIIGRTFTELVDNGDFADSSGWTLTGNSMNIANGKLELTYTGEIGVAYQLDVIKVGKKYNVSFDLSDLTNTQENRFLFVIYDFFRQELLLEIDLHEAGAGTYTDSFIGSTDTIIFGFINISSTGQSVSVDNISILREPEKAEHKVLVSLPEDVTSTVTWSYSPTTFTDANSIGIENVSGVDVTLTPTGTDLVVNGRQSKELELTRNYDSVGFSQCEITVTASWNQNIIIAGIEQTIPKEISTTVLLSARVT